MCRNLNIIVGCMLYYMCYKNIFVIHTGEEWKNPKHFELLPFVFVTIEREKFVLKPNIFIIC